MILPDVNVLVYAFRAESPDHERCRTWLAQALEAREPVALTLHVLAGFVRVVTHPRVFVPATPLADALAFVAAVKEAPASVFVEPSERAVGIFVDMCVGGAAKGALVSDALLAAIATDLGCELVTTDRDFARFPGLRWRHPLPES